MSHSLHDLGLLDAPPDQDFDNLTALAADWLNVPVAHISIYDKNRRRIFYKSQIGHPDPLAAARQLPMEMTYCQHVALTQDLVVVPDARDHPLIKDSPAFSEEQPLAYLGIPVQGLEQMAIGGLCLMQPEPRHWQPEEIARAQKLASCVTDLIRLRDEKLTSEALRSELERSNSELEAFAHAASHDLKSPLNTIVTAARWLERDLADHLDEDTRETMQFLRNRAERMNKMLDDMLEHSRIGHGETASDPVTIGALTEDVAILSARDGFKVETGDEAADICVQRMPLRNILLNLVTNGIKHHDRPNGTIRIDARDRGENIEFSVSDDGPGIPPQFHARVFDIFTTLEKQDKAEGVGMGLAMVKKHVQVIGGTLSLISEGRGTAFHFTWPKYA